MTAEETALTSKKGRAVAVLWLCVGIVVVAALIVAGMILGLPDTPESGFAGMAIMFGVMIWGPLLLIPVIGIALALRTKLVAEAQLRELRSHDSTKTV